MSIEIKHLTHIYNEGLPHETIALDDISFQVNSGEFFSIIGHTGSGKSTLIQHLNGLIKPKSGDILINGISIYDANTVMVEVRRKVGLVFQYPEYQLFEETVEKDVAFGLKSFALSEEETKERVKEALFRVGLNYDEIGDRSPFELSGGQKRRVAIAGVIVMKPEVLIMDEPTAGLDPKAHQDILDMVKQIHKVEKNSIIFVSHNMEDVAKLADRILVMDSGKVITVGTPREVYQKADLIARAGLDFPAVMQFAHKLEEKGISIRKDILTIEELEQEIVGYLGKEHA